MRTLAPQTATALLQMLAPHLVAGGECVRVHAQDLDRSTERQGAARRVDEVWASHQIPDDQIVQRPLRRAANARKYARGLQHSDVCLGGAVP